MVGPTRWTGYDARLLRMAMRMSQRTFAARLGLAERTVSKWEQAGRDRIPRPDTQAVLDTALVRAGDEARGRFDELRAQDAQPVALPPTSQHTLGTKADAIRTGMQSLRHALDRLDLPDDGPTRPLDDLAQEVARATEDRLQSRYDSLARRVPAVITELARVSQASGAHDRRRAAALLTLALRAADGLAFKFGFLDLSARTIDLMHTTSGTAEDPLLSAVVSYVRTETFFASGDLDTAARALARATEHLPMSAAPLSMATFGALHMRAAVVAGRSGKPDTAASHLQEARRAAKAVPDGTYHGTAFGPSSVRIHELAVAMELHDPAGIERAATWRPPRTLPAERRSHYYIDLARAQLALGHHDDAHHCLHAARHAAPEHTRVHPSVRQTLTTLLDTRRAPSRALLELSAWTAVR